MQNGMDFGGEKFCDNYMMDVRWSNEVEDVFEDQGDTGSSSMIPLMRFTTATGNCLYVELSVDIFDENRLRYLDCKRASNAIA